MLANRHTIAGKLQDEASGEEARTRHKLSPIPNITIRFATDGDAEAIAKLLFESFVEYEPLYTPEGFAATAITTEQVIARMREGPMWVAIREGAIREGAIAGTAAAVENEQSLYLRGMAVHPRARGGRIGEVLLNQIEAFAFKHNFGRLFLNTTPFLHRAIRLYEQFGFHRIDAGGPGDLFGTPLFTMESI